MKIKREKTEEQKVDRREIEKWAWKRMELKEVRRIEEEEDRRMEK